ncbi:MAG: HAMP domain-containing histidine kinase [Bacteroidales bacterium]|nr:HAMP domain-containing histidine kinase [Bacteroidales bacterium]MDD4638370.1 HAMP domain-containing sensor histidine kinase [Bacteroidales bacterium]
MIYSNEAFNSLINNDPAGSFLNPSFDALLKLDNSSALIFDGILTFGDYKSVNPSIAAQIFRKHNKLLIIGGGDTTQLLEQNSAMHQLNREIIGLQRDLIKKTRTLEYTLSQLNEANLELNRLNADKDRFIQILGHDLRGPFNTLLGFSEILLENLRIYDIDQVEELIKLIHKASQQTFNLLEDLLLWSKSQAGKLPFEPQKIVFEVICAEVISSLIDTARTKNILINFSEEETTTFSADPNMLKTVLRNLLSNAIKFTNQNGFISVYTEKSGTDITITISDNGVGIEKEDIAKLWDVSHNFTTKGTAGEKGTGLGLALCREFVEKHGGRIWAESEPGKGSDFKFTMPLSSD